MGVGTMVHRGGELAMPKARLPRYETFSLMLHLRVAFALFFFFFWGEER